MLTDFLQETLNYIHGVTSGENNKDLFLVDKCTPITNVCGTLLKTSSLLPPVLTIFLQETQNP